MTKGQVLLELVVALGLAMMALVAVVQVTTRSVSLVGYSKRQTESTTYADSAIEWVRNWKKDNGWSSFAAKASAGGTTYCLNDLSWAPDTDCKVITGTVYTREATLTTLGANQIQLVVQVSHQETTGAVVRTVSSNQTVIFSRY